MDDCRHLKTKKARITRSFLGKDFITIGKKCNSCGAILWDKSTDKKFFDWLRKLYKEENHRFQLQLGLSESATKCFEELENKYYGVPKSTLFRALTAVYMDLMKKSRFQSIIKEITAGEVYQSFIEGTKDRYKVLFRPFVIIEIEAVSDLTNRTPNKFVEDSIIKLLSLIYESDSELNEFWKKEVKEKLEYVLKVA